MSRDFATGGKFAASIVDTGGKFATVSTTLAKLVAQFAADVIDTIVKFAVDVIDTSGNFATGVIDTGGASWLANISMNFEKNWNGPTRIHWGGEKLIHEKNQKSF